MISLLHEKNKLFIKVAPGVPFKRIAGNITVTAVYLDEETATHRDPAKLCVV